MALPAGFVLEQSSNLPPGFALEENSPPWDSLLGTPTADYRAEALRKGLASTPAMVAGLGALYGESSAGQGSGIPQLIQALRKPSQPEPMRSPGEIYSSAQKPVYESIMSALGGTGAKPQTSMEKIIAGGLQAGADPLSYAFSPLAAIKRMGMFGQTLMRPAEQAIVGGGAEAGGMAGEYAGGKVDMPVAGRVVGGLLGGGGAAYGTGTLLKAAPLGGKAYDLAKGQWDKVRGTDPEDALLKDVNNRISNIFVAAGAADPNFMKTLTDAAQAQKGVSLKAPGGVEVNMPVSAMLADNPVINNFIQNLSARDPVFRAQYGAQYEAAKQALAANQIRLFGDPTKVIVTAIGPDLAKVQVRRVKSLDEQIADAYKGQSIDPNVFGQRVSNLIEKKEKSAYAEVKPLYTEAFDIAKSKNMELPAASVDDIYNSVVVSKDANVFRTFKPIFSKVERIFKPITVISTFIN